MYRLVQTRIFEYTKVVRYTGACRSLSISLKNQTAINKLRAWIAHKNANVFMKCERGDFRPNRFHAGTKQDFKEVLNKLAGAGWPSSPTPTDILLLLFIRWTTHEHLTIFFCYCLSSYLLKLQGSGANVNLAFSFFIYSSGPPTSLQLFVMDHLGPDPVNTYINTIIVQISEFPSGECPNKSLNNITTNRRRGRKKRKNSAVHQPLTRASNPHKPEAWPMTVNCS